MRWDRLFDDLEGQLEAERIRARDAEVADRVRRERARVALSGRLAAARGGAPVTAALTGTGVITGTVTEVGADWLSLADPAERESIVRLAAVQWFVGLPRRSDELPVVTRRFGFAAALRAVARDRAAVWVHGVAGPEMSGTIDAVGEDALDLAEHPVDVPRRAVNVGRRRTIPLARVAAVRRA